MNCGEGTVAGKKVLAVVNRKAGYGRAGKKWAELKNFVMRPYWMLDEAFTAGPRDATQITRDAIRAGYDIILAVGGDGTVNEVVNGFFDGDEQIGKSVQLGVVPVGSGSDFGRSFDQFVPHTRTGYLDRYSMVHPIDVGKIVYTGPDGKEHIHYFANVADIGIGAETVKRVERGYKKFGGRIGFFLGTLITMLVYKNIRLEVSFDDYQTEGRFASIVIANGRYFGGGMEIAPLARLSSGVFNILSIGDLKRLDMISNFAKVYKGTHLTHPRIYTREVKSVRVKSEKLVALETDGEFMDVREAVITIIPDAIDLIV